MDFESDEMFKLLKFKMSDWATAARLAQVAASVAQPGSGSGAAAASSKFKANAN